MALGSFVGIVAFRWEPNPVVDAIKSGPYIYVGLLVAISFVLGHLIFGGRLRRYRHDTWYLQFDTEKDREAIFWQKITVTVVCFVVIPFLAMFIAFGNQGFVKALE